MRINGGGAGVLVSVGENHSIVLTLASASGPTFGPGEQLMQTDPLYATLGRRIATLLTYLHYSGHIFIIADTSSLLRTYLHCCGHIFITAVCINS